MQTIKSKRGLLAHFEGRSESARDYFEHIPKLVAEFPLDVSLAYVFAQVEKAHVMALYCGIVKLHRTDGEVTWKAVHGHYMTRDGFKQKYETIYGKGIASGTIDLLVYAEEVRDKVMHGKTASDDNKRNAIAHVLQYADDLNSETAALRGPKPFGDLRGFKGRGKSLDKGTSRWVLKGMGFGV
jgi:hypothetical protein